MKRVTRLLSRIFSGVQDRFHEARPGSVLILVVALLVLLALAGTAMISTARVDRYAVQQHSANTEVDLLIEGVVRIVNSVLVDDLFATGPTGQVYRPPYEEQPLQPGANFGAYEHADSPYGDNHLASRTPIATGANTPQWFAVTGPLVPTQVFEDPQTGVTYPTKFLLNPTWQKITYPAGAKLFPALISQSSYSNTWVGYGVAGPAGF